MKAWLKGGLMVLGIYFLLTLVLIPFGSTSGDSAITWWSIPSFAGMLISFILVGRLEPALKEKLNLLSLSIMFIVSIIFWFLIGAVIGSIISKIKEKKK